jgi:pentatricopeptide repeat protein
MELYRRRTFSTVETTDSTSSAHHVNDQEPNDSLVQPTSPTQQQQQPQQVPHDTLRITARKLLDQRIFPIGSYTEKHLEIIKTILDTFQNNSHESAKKLPLAEVTTLSLELLLRACKEIGTKTAAAANIEKSTTEVATSSNDPVVPDSKSTMFSSFSQNIWIWELQYLSEILKQWQRCRAQKLNVVDGKELFHLFQCMLQSCPGLHPKISTMHVLMDCFVNYVRYKDGVHMALELLQIIDQHDMGPVDEYLYSQAVHAWSMIHHAKTPGIMGKLLRTLHERDIPLTETSYLIVLRYWARCGGGQTQHLQELYDYMKTQQTTISSTANALLIEGYANNGELEHAEKLFDEFRSTNALDEVTPPEAELPPLIRCAHDIIKGYHIIAVDSTQLYADREIAAAKAISFFLKYHAQGVFNSFNGSNIGKTQTHASLL